MATNDPDTVTTLGPNAQKSPNHQKNSLERLQSLHRSEHEIKVEARTRICEEALSEIRVFESQDEYFPTSKPPQNRAKAAANGPHVVRTLAQKAEKKQRCKPFRGEKVKLTKTDTIFARVLDQI